MPAWLRHPPYILSCTVLGLLLGWGPFWLHGPVPEKFNPHFIHGEVVVWAYYGSRMAIGLLVGISIWPRAWFVRGPLLGALLMLPTGLLSVSIPECGPP